MKPIPIIAFLSASLAVAAGSALPARAESPNDIPNPRVTKRSWVADNANVLSDATERKINDLLTPLYRKTGAEIAVVTVNSLDGMPIEDFSIDLFKRWKIGKKGKDNGMLILAAIKDRRMRIEVDYGWESQITDAQAKEITSTIIKPAFKRGDYNGGLYEGTYAVARRIDPSLPARSSGSVAPNPSSKGSGKKSSNSPFGVPDDSPAQIPNQAPSYNSPDYSQPNSGGSAGGLLLMLLVLGGGGALTVVYLGSRPPRCPKCKTGMELVPENQEDPYLTDVQKLEESLGGREWNAWRCPRDGYIGIMSHDKWLSSVATCQRCQNRTATSTTQVLQYATEFHSGLEQTTSICHNPACHYSSTSERTIPRVMPVVIVTSGGNSGGFGGGSDSSSSSSSSSSSGSYDSGPSDFGGGDGGGGGGASDSW